jgi:hypothetical protein
MVFAMLFCLQKPYFYKNTMFAVAAAACMRSFCSFCSYVRLLFLRYESNQLHSSAFYVVVDCDVALGSGDVAMPSQASKHKYTHALVSK